MRRPGRKSDRILELAKKEAAEIKAAAEQERHELVSQTKSEMENYRKKVLTEIRMSARKTANLVKNQLHALLLEGSIGAPVQKSLADPEVMKSVLEACAGSLSKGANGSWRLEVSEEMRQLIFPAVEAGKKELLAKGIELAASGDILNGFVIREEGGSYRIVFDDATFIRFLGQFLKVETRNLLE